MGRWGDNYWFTKDEGQMTNDKSIDISYLKSFQNWEHQPSLLVDEIGGLDP